MVQREQVTYWLNFLNSSLPLPPPPLPENNSWHILLVGLQADHPASTMLKTNYLTTWQEQWRSLPLYPSELFHVSALKSEASVQHLLDVAEIICDKVFQHHAVHIPESYSQVLERIKSNVQTELCQEDECYAMYGEGVDMWVFSSMLQYFHQIGQIVWLKGGLVCTDPQQIPKIAAKFISPEEVQARLLNREDENVQILSTDDVGYILNIGSITNQR